MSSHPKEMFLLSIVGTCQRFTFWGVTMLLVIYLIDVYQFGQDQALSFYATFTASAFTLQIVGGYIGDRFSHKKPLFYSSIFATLGSLFLALEIQLLVIPALVLLGCSVALFNPSLTALLSRLYHDKSAVRNQGFSMYYMLNNSGIFLALIILGYVSQHYGWSAVYYITMSVALIGLIPLRVALKTIENGPIHYRSGPKLNMYEKERIAVIVILSLVSIIFWISYAQIGSSIALLAERATHHPAAWILSSEIAFVMLLCMPLTYIYNKIKRAISPLSKIIIGLFLLAISFLFLSQSKESISMIVTSLAIMALAELLIAPISLSVITHLSPHKYVALLVGFTYFCMGSGFYFGGSLVKLMNDMSTQQFFSIFVFISLAVALTLLFIAKRLNQMRHME